MGVAEKPAEGGVVRAGGSDPSNLDGYTITHRGGTRVEVGRPIFLPTAREPATPWLCTVKLLGPMAPTATDGPEEQEATQTILLRSGRGRSAEEAQRVALTRLSLVYGTPSEAPPQVVIRRLSSAPPEPRAAAPGPLDGVKGLWMRIRDLFRRA